MKAKKLDNSLTVLALVVMLAVIVIEVTGIVLDRVTIAKVLNGEEASIQVLGLYLAAIGTGLGALTLGVIAKLSSKIIKNSRGK